MAKGPGGTRVSTSDNPTGNGRRRVNASAPRTQLEIEDRIIALEGERDRLRNEGSGNGPGFDTVRIDQINDEIDELREQYRQAGGPQAPTRQEQQRRAQFQQQIKDAQSRIKELRALRERFLDASKAATEERDKRMYRNYADSYEREIGDTETIIEQAQRMLDRMNRRRNPS